jgi:hypothetical protein
MRLKFDIDVIISFCLSVWVIVRTTRMSAFRLFKSMAIFPSRPICHLYPHLLLPRCTIHSSSFIRAQDLLDTIDEMKEKAASARGERLQLLQQLEELKTTGKLRSASRAQAEEGAALEAELP